jgi:hypothetical protein
MEYRMIGAYWAGFDITKKPVSFEATITIADLNDHSKSIFGQGTDKFGYFELSGEQVFSQSNFEKQLILEKRYAAGRVFTQKMKFDFGYIGTWEKPGRDIEKEYQAYRENFTQAKKDKDSNVQEFEEPLSKENWLSLAWLAGAIQCSLAPIPIL